MPFLIIAALFLFLLFLSAVVWTNLQVRQQPGYQLDEKPFPAVAEGLDLKDLRADPTALRNNLARRYTDLDEFALGRVVRMLEAEPPPTINIDRKLRITFPISVYINQPFELKVSIASENGQLPPLTNKEQQVSRSGDTLRFPAHEEKPPIQVELQFPKEEFNVNTTKQLKALEKDQPTVFSFLVKPLKAEACVLTVVISYAPKRVDSGQLEEVSEQLEKTTTDTISSSDHGLETTQHVEQVTRKATISEPIVVKTEQVKAEVKSLFGLNTAELTIWKGILGAVAALILLVIALVTKQTDGLNAVVLVIGCAANAFGIPIYDGVTKLFGQKKQGG